MPKELKTFVASYPTRGTQTILIHNCGSKAEARRKLQAYFHESGDHPDVDPVSHDIESSYPKSATIQEDSK